jgi:hypothetical protein
MSLTGQKGKSIERSRYEKGPHISGYSDGGLGMPHGAGMPLVAATGSSGSAGTTASPDSGLDG